MTHPALAEPAPWRAPATDAAFLAVLLALGIIGFRTTYGGSTYLVAAAIALVLGLVLAHLAARYRQPALALTVVTVVVFFIAGPPAALRAAPNLAALSSLSDVSLHGWKDLLTTLPPVGDHGPLLAIPYLLSLVGAVLGLTLAERTRNAFAPLVAPIAVLAAVLLLGTQTAPAVLLQGSVFGCVAIAWVAIRTARTRPVVHHRSGRAMRGITAAAMLVVAGLLAIPLGPVLPGAGSHHRTVLRSYVTPPFEVGRYPSPLVAYRRYMTVDKDTKLFTVDLPAGSAVRIATLDSYDGSVWGAGTDGAPATGDTGFQRVGDTIATSARGTGGTLHLTIHDGWSGPDADVWLPARGAVTGVALPHTQQQDSFRYDLNTGTGIVPSGFAPGDRITVHTVTPAPVTDADPRPFGTPLVTGAQVSFVRDEAASLLKASCSGSAGTSSDAWVTLTAVEKAMKNCGALSHGEGADQTQYAPGHSEHRLGQMIAQPQLVGDDEQYAALLALISNDLGYPARVVVGAVVPAGGAVVGADVHAWVEVHVDNDQWLTLPSSDFVPTRPPSKQPPPQVDQKDPQPLPPPATSRLPSSTDQPDLTAAEGRTNRAKHGGWFHIPGFVVAIVRYAGPPVLLVALVCGAILGAKALRRKRRRTRGDAPARLAAGWQEVLDQVRDRGAPVARDLTRREQARALAELDLARLAREADSGIFGPGVPSDEQVEHYWRQVDAFRAGSVQGLGRWHRWRIWLNPASVWRSGLGGVGA